MGIISEEDIERVKTSVNIVDVINRFVPLKKAGKNYVGLCPFHPDSSPSFNVSPDRQIFKCFGCGKAGSVFTFLMEHNRMDFPTAVRSLADEAGIEIRTDDRSRGPGGDGRRQLFQAMDFAASLYRRVLLSPTGADARAYLEGRSIPPAVQERFGLGFAPEQWSTLLDAGRKRRIAPALFEKAGLAAPRKSGSGYYDRFRNRITFPIVDLQGRVLGFGGRLLSGEGPKYINSPETPIYNKGRILYGLPLAREHDLDKAGLILVEGYTDVIALHMAGFPTAVASLGTALTQDQARLVRRFADRVYLVYDADPAGQAAMERGVELLLKVEVDARVLTLPRGSDPADFLAQQGPDAFQRLLDGAPDVFDFKLALLEGKLDLSAPAGRTRAVDEMLGLVLTVSNAVHQDLLLRRVADALNVPEPAVAARARELASPRKRAPAPARPAVPTGRARDEAAVFQALLCDNRLIADALNEFPPERFQDEELREAAQVMYARWQAGRSVGLADILRRSPTGVLARLADKLTREEEAEEPPDFGRLYRDGVDKLKRTSRLSQVRRIQTELRAAEKAGDPARKEALLRRLQELR